MKNRDLQPLIMWLCLVTGIIVLAFIRSSRMSNLWNGYAVSFDNVFIILYILPLRIFRFSGKAFTEGVEAHEMDGVSVRSYSPEKTLADCFKYRNKIGMDTALEALKLSLVPLPGPQTKTAQWKAFIRKSRLENAPEELAEITSAIALFLESVIAAMVAGGTFSKVWKAPGPWQTR
jgi:hypothetical protein